MHGGGSVEPVLYTSNGDGTVTGKVLYRPVGPAFELSSRIDLYGGRAGDMPCSKRKRRLAGSTAAGEPGQDVITNPEYRDSSSGRKRFAPELGKHEVE